MKIFEKAKRIVEILLPLYKEREEVTKKILALWSEKDDLRVVLRQLSHLKKEGYITLPCKSIDYDYYKVYLSTELKPTKVVGVVAGNEISFMLEFEKLPGKSFKLKKIPPEVEEKLPEAIEMLSPFVGKEKEIERRIAEIDAEVAKLERREKELEVKIESSPEYKEFLEICGDPAFRRYYHILDPHHGFHGKPKLPHFAKIIELIEE